MSNAIPKEQLSAYQRWELASFGDDRPSPPAQGEQAQTQAQHAEKLAKAQEQARQEGYQNGLAQGRLDGYEAGMAAAALDIAALRSAALGFTEELVRSREGIAEEALDLALDLTKAMLKAALPVRPELVLPVVAEAVRYLPSLQHPAILFLHPEDAILVREHMGEELSTGGWRVAEDSQLQRGDCRVETASNQIDASMATRWQRIANALGRDQDWLL